MNRIKPEKFAKIGFSNSCISNTHSQLNFRGLPKCSELAERFGEDFGQAAKKYFREIIENAKKYGLKVHNDEIKFPGQTLSQKALEIITYPIMQMPFDFANAMIDGLKKIPVIKKFSWLDELYHSKLLTKKREAANSKSHIAAIKHYLELLEKEKGEKGYLKRFAEGHTRLKPLMPNYNSESERSLNRLVTGMIPAFFLANDAYNLSMYMNNDKDAAKKEKKRRFNQEVVRIGISSAATYAVMSLFAKRCNESIPLTAGITAGLVLVSEVMGRLMAGNPVLPVTAKEAKEYAQKRKEVKQNKTEENKTQTAAPSKKEFLTLKNILITLAGLTVFGFAADKTSKIKFVSEKLGKFNDWYKKLYTKDSTIKRKDFNILMDKLRNNGFNEIAEEYETWISGKQGETIKLGSIKNKIKYILIHQILAFPVTFTWKVLTLPYNSLVKPLIRIIKGETKAEKKIEKIEILQNSVRFLEKIENDKPEEFTRKVNEKLISSFDNLTKSKYQNSNLNVTVKTAASAVTTGFLIADNYNMVMIDSNGKDKDLAEQKAKERAMQRGARLTYEAFIMKMVLDMFAGICSASLVGALAVSGVLRVITEIFERKAVGLPLQEATREEIKENETNHLNATGVKGSYFRAMAAVTGKKTFSPSPNFSDTRSSCRKIPSPLKGEGEK